MDSWRGVILNRPTLDDFNNFDTISCPGQVQAGKVIEETNNTELSCQSEGIGGPVSATVFNAI